MVQATIFKNNTSQAVRLPKSVAMPEGVKEVDVVAVGASRIITPAGMLWDEWFESPAPEEGFMLNRDQPSSQKREPFDD